LVGGKVKSRTDDGGVKRAMDALDADSSEEDEAVDLSNT
jgi:hypothetical protein